MITLKEIAAEIGVSVAAVSYVYNDKWREKRIAPEQAERIAAKIRERHYYPSALGRQLKTRKTETIGIILEDLTRELSLNILCGIEKVFAEAGFFALVCNSKLGASEEEQLAMLAARSVDGVIISPVGSGDTVRWVNQLAKEGKPVVMIDNYRPELQTDFVVTDNFRGAFEAATFLLEKGYRRIAYFGSRKRLAVLIERFHGFCSALEKHDCPLDMELVDRQLAVPEDFYRSLEIIFAKGRPDAMFVESLSYSGEVFRFLSERGLSVPDDIGITGVDPVNLNADDAGQAHFHAVVKQPIPFVEQPGTKIGELAAQIVLDRIGGKEGSLVQEFVMPTFRTYDNA